ncbi:DNA/RNA helicase domain-containing protein [Myroides odoratus]|uniref:DNA/RNA helicase domain-containing protein n=1 Tax=Myroides odoratus TaxID=256 RepID=UPI000765C769|nr:DNA/RNA helicase domain-containing protein [Myroides odoratus]
MKEINLLSILSAYKNLDKEAFESFLLYHNIKIKVSEIKDLHKLVQNFTSISKNTKLLDKYFIGYSIPQIGKEFDLLRIDNETIVNIELKRSSTEDKIKTQLLRNLYYLSFLKKKISCYTYVSDDDKLYTLDNTNNLEEVNFRQLISELVSQDVLKIKNINSYFNPSNYLVSPFNSTSEFTKGKYFLTLQQEEIKNIVLAELIKPSYSILSIKGNAGTGKTLLTYDVAKEVLNKKEVILIHCGILNNGHYQLRNDYGWTIISAKNIVHQDYSKYHLIIVDEAQRIRPTQLNFLIEKIKKTTNNIIFSYDAQQTLRKQEIVYNAVEKIENSTTILPFELTTKIRTNKEVASFIQCLLSKKRALVKHNYENIEIFYFDNYDDAKNYQIQLRTEGWKVINYTPSTVDVLPYEQHNLEDELDNAHTVIGQEFDSVVAVIDSHFYYKSGYLSTRNYNKYPYYHPTKMLFQIVSRTRIKLGIVIINNQEVLNRCMEILNQK